MLEDKGVWQALYFMYSLKNKTLPHGAVRLTCYALAG
jgi:hypothetical protein